VETKLAGEAMLWDSLPYHMRRIRSDRPPELDREELDPGLELAEITRFRPRGRTRQLFAFDVDVLEPLILVLPMQRFKGWHLELDGEPHPLFATGPDMLGVHVPRGAHRLIFRWKMPAWHWATLIATFAAMAFVLGVWARAIYRRARGRRSLR
jgi:hypothetical protein